MSNVEWLEMWYLSNCDGDWEHDHGIAITNVDNPGWLVEIDFNGTELKVDDISIHKIEQGEGDWYFFKILNNMFTASGDCRKLNFLLGIFRDIVERTHA
jgi:hypothetical protein